MKKEGGNIGDLMAAGICMLAMTVIMLVYLENAGLIQQKMEISQIARKYILRMETVGALTVGDKSALCQELDLAGVKELRLEGTTFVQAGYGEPIILQIKGKLKNGYDFTEKRVSTAKH